MRDLPFPYVTITDQFGETKNIRSIVEAEIWLVAHWPMGNSDRLTAAKRACLDAPAGGGHLYELSCMEALIEAAKETGIYVTHTRL